MEILLTEEQIKADLIRNINQPDDVLRRYLGEDLWKAVTSPKVAGTRNPTASIAAKTAWRRRIAAYFEDPRHFRKVVELVESRGRPPKTDDLPKKARKRAA